MLINHPVYESNPRKIKNFTPTPNFRGKIYVELRYGKHDYFYPDGLYSLTEGWRSQNLRATDNDAIYLFTIFKFKDQYKNFYLAIQANGFDSENHAKQAIDYLLKTTTKE